MTDSSRYEPLTPESMGTRLGQLEAMTSRLGNAEQWSVREVGDGNLNLVFIVEGGNSSVIVKQALPYVRLVGDSWPLPLYRAFYEHCALVRQARRAPGSVPEIFHFDKGQALIIMEHLTPHIILRNKLINGEQVLGAGQFVGEFCAQTAFRGSELCMASAEKKADVALFAGNVEIPAITESLVFTDPYYAAEMNNHNPLLDPVVDSLRANTELKHRVQKMLMKFASNTETMVHGDLHSGSIMATADELKVIDPEFVQYGPLGFDLGMATANFLMAYFSQPGHRSDNLESCQAWILSVIEDCFTAFASEFKRLWSTERTGMLFPSALFEEQGHDSGFVCDSLLRDIYTDAFAFCGIEMHRRCLSLAHNADFENIEDPAIRAPLEARNLVMGAQLVLESDSLQDISSLIEMAKSYNQRSCL